MNVWCGVLEQVLTWLLWVLHALPTAMLYCGAVCLGYSLALYRAYHDIRRASTEATGANADVEAWKQAAQWYADLFRELGHEPGCMACNTEKQGYWTRLAAIEARMPALGGRTSAGR